MLILYIQEEQVLYIYIDNVDWTPQAVLAREEEWLNNNRGVPNNINNGNVNLQNVDLVIMNRNMFYGNDIMQQRLRRHLIGMEEENNRMFACGLLIGMVCNIYTIFFLLFCNPRPKFKKGLQLGMVIGTIIYVIISLLRLY